jgi:hypothetical protein
MEMEEAEDEEAICGRRRSKLLQLSGMDPLGIAKKLPMRKNKSDSY